MRLCCLPGGLCDLLFVVVSTNTFFCQPARKKKRFSKKSKDEKEEKRKKKKLKKRRRECGRFIAEVLKKKREISRGIDDVILRSNCAPDATSGSRYKGIISLFHLHRTIVIYIEGEIASFSLNNGVS